MPKISVHYKKKWLGVFAIGVGRNSSLKAGCNVEFIFSRYLGLSFRLDCFVTLFRIIPVTIPQLLMLNWWDTSNFYFLTNGVGIQNYLYGTWIISTGSTFTTSYKMYWIFEALASDCLTQTRVHRCVLVFSLNANVQINTVIEERWQDCFSAFAK